MDDTIEQLCRQALAGELSESDLLRRIAMRFGSRGHDVMVDHDRLRRCGFPEAIYAEGKSNQALRDAVALVAAADQPAFCTRVTSGTGSVLAR